MGNLKPVATMREVSRAYRMGRVPVRDARAAFFYRPTRTHNLRPSTSWADHGVGGGSRLRCR